MPHTLAHPATATVKSAAVKPLYFALSERYVEPAASEAAAAWLRHQLDRVDRDGNHLPQGADAFAALAQAHSETVGQQYHHYLAERKAGAPRRYFATRAQALYFLQGVAPTKLVDGAWLFGLLPRWREPGVRPLITTYLEELGNGVPENNHALIYRELLEEHGCNQWQALGDEYFVQGLVQLTLARHAHDFLPELIGYNLSYEQLPLHLMITAFELDELGIDPHYFSLHMTADNANNGHARKAWEAAEQLLPQMGDSADFERRIANGYRLGDLGVDPLAIIDGFDLYAELARILRAKGPRNALSSEFCKIGGQSLRAWLQTGQPPAA
ncbi:MAG: iron-containing redox enzyme family protein, partial [Massilia sp.]